MRERDKESVSVCEREGVCHRQQSVFDIQKVCVCERERERVRERERESERERER